MANATSISVTSLAEGGDVAQPTADVLDTGTAAVTISADVGGVSSRIMLEVKNTAAATATVSVLAGDKPPAERAGLGALTTGAMAQNAVRIMGPFESARFIQDNGKIDVTFTPSSGTIGFQIRCYKLPKL